MMVIIKIDSREASTNPQLLKLLETLSDESVIVEKMNVGDILIGKFLFERKATTDLLTRNDDGSLHIFDQLKRLKEQEDEGLIPTILVDGFYHNAWKYGSYKTKKTRESQIFGLLNSIVYSYHIPYILVNNEQQLETWLKNIIKRAHDPNKQQLISLRTTPKRKMSDDEQSLYILQGYKGVGASKSKKILTEFGSIDTLIYETCKYTGSGMNRLESIIGKKYTDQFIQTNKHIYGVK